VTNETVAITHRWLSLIAEEIGDAKIDLVDLYLHQRLDPVLDLAL
jgi:hypothetical protein